MKFGREFKAMWGNRDLCCDKSETAQLDLWLQKNVLIILAHLKLQLKLLPLPRASDEPRGGLVGCTQL